ESDCFFIVNFPSVYSDKAPILPERPNGCHAFFGYLGNPQRSSEVSARICPRFGRWIEQSPGRAVARRRRLARCYIRRQSRICLASPPKAFGADLPRKKAATCRRTPKSASKWKLELLRVEQQAQPATLYARELIRAAQLLRRQRVTYVGFDDRDIRRSDRAAGVHVFAEIRATDRLAHLRFSQGDIGGIHSAASVHIANQNAHRNVHIDSRLIARAIHSVDADVDHLDIGNVGKRYCYHVPADAHCSVRVAGPTAPD